MSLTNPITANTDEPLDLVPGFRYFFSAVGNFGSGTFSIEYLDSNGTRQTVKTALTSDGDFDFYAQEYEYFLVLSGATTPSISYNVTKLVTEVDAETALAGRGPWATTITVADYATMKAGSYEIGQLVKNESTQAVYRYNGSGEFTLFLGGGFPKTLTDSITFACTEARSIGLSVNANGLVTDRGNIMFDNEGYALDQLPPAFTPITVAPYDRTTDTLTGIISQVHASNDGGWSVNAELVFIDLSNAPNIYEFHASNSLLETIDFSGCTGLELVNLSGNNLVEVKGLGDTELEDMYSHYTALDLSNNQLDSDALNEIYASLPQGAYGSGYPRTIIVTGNPGVGAGSGSNPALAVGWTVVGDIA